MLLWLIWKSGAPFCMNYNYFIIPMHKWTYSFIYYLITRLIVIDIAPLTMFFCNCPLFCKLICNWPPLKHISFITKCLLVCCDFWHKSPLCYLEILKLPEQFIPNCPPNMWLLVLIAYIISFCKLNFCFFSVFRNLQGA